MGGRIMFIFGKTTTAPYWDQGKIQDHPPLNYFSANHYPSSEAPVSRDRHDERYYPEGKEYRRIDQTGPNEQQNTTPRTTSSRYANSVRLPKNDEPSYRFQGTSYSPQIAHPSSLPKRSMVGMTPRSATDDYEGLPPRQRGMMTNAVHTELSQVQQYKNNNTLIWMAVFVVAALSSINIAYYSGLVSRYWTAGLQLTLKSNHSDNADKPLLKKSTQGENVASKMKVKAQVSCGNHFAPTRADCPQGNGASWCNGDYI